MIVAMMGRAFLLGNLMTEELISKIEFSEEY